MYRNPVDADADADADARTRQEIWEPRSRGVSEQPFVLPFGAALETLRRHGHCVFLRWLPGAYLPVGHGVGGVPTAVLKRDLEGVEARLRGLADRLARVEAELLRITCEETFLCRQQRRLLRGIFAAKHGEDADAVDCGPEVEVASGPAPAGLDVS